MSDVIRLGVIATADPEPEREVAIWRADLERGAIDDPDETRERLAALERGDYALAELHCFAELARDGSLVRCGDTIIRGCWLSRGAHAENQRHISELVKEHLDDLQSDLAASGVEVDVHDLASVPVHLEIDGALAMTQPQAAER